MGTNTTTCWIHLEKCESGHQSLIQKPHLDFQKLPVGLLYEKVSNEGHEKWGIKSLNRRKSSYNNKQN